jgi:hypothetical protein
VYTWHESSFLFIALASILNGLVPPDPEEPM